MFFSRYLSINEKFTYTCSWQEANSRPSDGVSTAAHKTQTNNARPDKTDQSRRGFKVAVTCVVVCSICFPQTAQTHRSHHHVMPLWVLLWLADKSRLLWGGNFRHISCASRFRKLSITRAFAKTVNSFLFYISRWMQISHFSSCFLRQSLGNDQGRDKRISTLKIFQWIFINRNTCRQRIVLCV